MTHSFFGVQIALHAPPGDAWRSELHAVVRAQGGDQSLVEKRAYYTRLTNLLESAEARYRFGAWDYVVGDRADAEFDDWVAGLEAAASENPGDDVDDEHVVATLVFLLEAGSNSDTTVAERCDISESQWFTRDTFQRLLACVRALSFSSVRADGAYVVPGEGGPGFSAAEFCEEGWDYLRPISGATPPPLPT